MKVIGAVSLGLAGLALGGLVVVEMLTAQTKSAEAQTVTDVTSTLGGTWTLKQRLNPDGTPYAKVTGVTYISIKSRTGDSLGAHAVATIYSKESGVADTHFFAYPADIANKPFTMESSGTWLINNVENTSSGAVVASHVTSMTKGTIPPYNNGAIMTVDVRYNVARVAAKAGAAAVTPRVMFTTANAGQLTDFAGKAIPTTSLTAACCGMSSLSIQGNTMEITWSNKGRDTWVRSTTAVPAAYR